MSKPLILVTGATGTVGGEVVNQLSEAGQRVRALVRNPAKLAFLEGTVEIAQADLLKPETLGAAFEGVDGVFIVAPPSSDIVAMEANAFEAAQQVGVEHIVYTFGSQSAI